MLSVIIPVLNEEKFLIDHMSYYRHLCKVAPVLFVDGGSVDKTQDIIGAFDAKLVQSKGPRSAQKNYGAAISQSRYLIFLHVDSLINLDDITSLNLRIHNQLQVGCFTMSINHSARIFRVYEFIINFRAKYLGILDGDLGLIIRKDIFEHLGGFDEVAVMEDVLFGKKLKSVHKVEALNQNIYVSSRKWQEDGFMKTFFTYSLSYFKLWFGRLRPQNA